ncbi:hypothetical protein DY000_02053630 [Brassica cretica]|uniref:Uncharacterized protein n=1 Tax=Brassica cretica TaxID=69181 RepID=A0ABQ7ALC9_BRACR|nr:hypothetical protein DY000_02053630 [Brassica cretica]
MLRAGEETTKRPREAMAVRLWMKVLLRGVLRNSGFFEVRGRRSELSSHSLPPDGHCIHSLLSAQLLLVRGLVKTKTGFTARPRFTFGLRLCDDKSAFVLPV